MFIGIYINDQTISNEAGAVMAKATVMIIYLLIYYYLLMRFKYSFAI